MRVWHLRANNRRAIRSTCLRCWQVTIVSAGLHIITVTIAAGPRYLIGRVEQIRDLVPSSLSSSAHPLTLSCFLSSSPCQYWTFTHCERVHSRSWCSYHVHQLVSRSSGLRRQSHHRRRHNECSRPIPPTAEADDRHSSPPLVHTVSKSILHDCVAKCNLGLHRTRPNG
jgi:hypothetical protein